MGSVLWAPFWFIVYHGYVLGSRLGAHTRRHRKTVALVHSGPVLAPHWWLIVGCTRQEDIEGGEPLPAIEATAEPVEF